MARRDVIVLGASAGGIEALTSVLAGLPADLPATVLVVLHVPPTGGEALPRILDRAGPLTARGARVGDPLKHGDVLVAPPDHHLLVVDGSVTLSRGPRENGHRPAVDVLFRSAARALGPRVVSVVLSGVLDDGAAGSVAVASRGGTVLAQLPEDALYPGMPRAAVETAGAEPVELAALPTRLAALLAEDIDPDSGAAPSELQIRETDMAEMDAGEIDALDRPGDPSGFSCPDCHGSLFTIEEGGLRRYRCRVGHAWSAESLLVQHDVAVEGALWMALRGLEEKAALAADMAGRARDNGQPLSADRFDAQSAEVRGAADLIRRLLVDAAGRDEASPVPDVQSA